MILDDTATVCHVMHREGFRTRASVHDDGKEGGRNMHLLILCDTAHCVLASTAYHVPKMARWQDKVASLLLWLLSGPA